MLWLLATPLKCSFPPFTSAQKILFMVEIIATKEIRARVDEEEKRENARDKRKTERVTNINKTNFSY